MKTYMKTRTILIIVAVWLLYWGAAFTAPYALYLLVWAASGILLVVMLSLGVFMIWKRKELNEKVWRF